MYMKIDFNKNLAYVICIITDFLNKKKCIFCISLYTRDVQKETGKGP